MDPQDIQYKTNEQEQKSKKPIPRKSISAKKQKAIISRVMDDIQQMIDYKRNGCYYDALRTSIDDRYKRDDDLFLMWKEENADGWSNVASSALYRNQQAIAGEFSDTQIMDILRPTDLSDTSKLKIMEKILANWNKRHSLETVDKRTFEEMSRYGIGIEKIHWKRITRKVKEVKKNVKETEKLTEKEYQRLVENNEIPYQWVDFIQFNDVIKENVDPDTFFVEPGAYRLYGHTKSANKCATIEWISYDDFLLEVKSDPGVIKDNIDLVKRSGHKTSDDVRSEASKTPDSYDGLVNQVKKTVYYNVVNDEIVTLYNDFLLKVGPLPFHVLPFVDHHFMEFKGYFYTPGLGALLDPTIREQEDIKNALIDELKLKINPPTYVDDMAYDSIATGIERFKPGELIPVEGLASSGGQLIREHPVAQSRSVEAFQMLGVLDQNIVEIAGIDPKRLGSIQRTGSATEASLMDAASAKVIRMILSNYLRGRVESTKLVYKWIVQEYTKALAMKINGDKDKTKIPTKIILEGVEIKYPKTDKEKLIERRIQGYSQFDLEKEHLEVKSEPLFEIAPESIQKLTEAQDIQKLQNALPQMIPLAGDPRTVQPGQPMPVFNITAIGEHYRKKMGFPESFINYVEVDEDQEREIARKENQDILSGKYVIGTKGRCLAHVQEHETGIMLMIDQLESMKKLEAARIEKEEKALEDIQKTIEGVDPAMMAMVPGIMQQPADTTESTTAINIMELEKNVKNLIKHYAIDKLSPNEPIPFEQFLAETTPQGFHTMPDGTMMADNQMPPAPPMPGAMPPEMMGGMPPGMDVNIPQPSLSQTAPAMSGSPIPSPTQVANVQGY
jgi:hypothetical protein